MTGAAAPRSLGALASRGAVINLAFGIGLQGLALVQGIVVPRLVGPSNMGLFSIALGGVVIGSTLKELGIPQKLVQDRDTDLYTSYAVAFTLEVLLAGTFFGVVLGLAPLLAGVYDRPELWPLISVLAFTIFSTAFVDLPAALPYREMRFLHRNLLTMLAPLTTFVVTVPAAMAGWGVWSMVAGQSAGFFVSIVVLLVGGPLKPRFAWEPRLVRRYLAFGWPLWLASVAGLVGGWGAIFAVSSVVGVVGVGYFGLAQSWASRALQVDAILSDTIFPALCSIQASTDRLRRAFIITNRLSMLWAATVGVGLALFGEPVIRLFLGREWLPAVILVQAEGAGVVVNSIGFNWTMFSYAKGRTRPQLVVSLLGLGWLVVVAIPLILWLGIDGAAWSIVVLAVSGYFVRQHYVNAILGRLSLARTVWREVSVAMVAGAVVLSARSVGWEPVSIPGLLLQGLAYLVLTGLGALVTTRRLILDTLTLIRKRPAPTPEPEPPVALHDGEDSLVAAGLRPAGTLVEHVTVSDDPPPAPAAAVGVRRTHAIPRPLSFPLGVAVDDRRAVWVTTRDWPAVGRLDPVTDEWAWAELSSFPHVPTPDGQGGCWTALTRTRALVHLDDDLRVVTRHRLPNTRELLVTVMAEGRCWAVDAHRHLLWHCTDDDPPEAIALGDGFDRPDFVAVAPDRRLWVADTHGEALAVVDPSTGAVESRRAPGPTRSVIAAADGSGMWLGSSRVPEVWLLDTDGAVVRQIELPGVPFGLVPLADGRLIVVLKALDQLAIVEPDAGVSPILIDVPAGSGPSLAATAPDGSAVVTFSSEAAIAEIVLPAAAQVSSA